MKNMVARNKQLQQLQQQQQQQQQGMNFSVPIARRTRAQEALYLKAEYVKRRKVNGDGGGSSSNGRNLNHAQKNHSLPAISIDKDEDEAIQVEDGGSISLNNKTAEHSTNVVKQFTSSSEDGDVYGDGGDRNDDVKGGRFDEDAEEENYQSFCDNGDKGSFGECNGRKSGESDRGEVKARDSPMLEREKAKEAELDPGRCFSVPISLDSEEDEATEIENDDKGMKSAKTFASFSKDSTSVEEESTSSSEDEEDSEGKFEEDDEDEEEDQRRRLKRKRSFKVNASLPAKKRGTHNPMSYVSNGCIAQRTRSHVGWTSSVKNGRNRKFETTKGYSSESSMDAHHHGVEEVEEVEMKDGGAAAKVGGGIDLHFISSDTEDDLPDKCSVSVDESTSSSESEDGDEEDSDDTYEEGDEDEVHVEEEEEEEEERSVESLKRKRSFGVQVSVSVEKDKNNRKTFVSNRKDKAIPDTFASNGGAAQLNGSNFNWKSSEKKSKKEKLDNADDGTAMQAGEKEDDELGKSMKKMHVGAPKKDTVFKLFVNTIWKNGEELQKKYLGNSEDEAAEQAEIDSQEPVAETPLPLKFSFGIQMPKPKEKSDYEKEMDPLWVELEFALRSGDIGSFATMVDVEDANEQQTETDPSTSCELGKHHFILDEQIGILCRFCSVVEQEIKYVLPSMATCAWERFGKRNDCGEGDFSMMDGVKFQDKGGDCQDSSVHTRGTIWEKFPEIRKKMFPHQQDGFEFIWKNLAGGIDLDVINSKCSDGVGGCVISHAPGTGKTFLTIAFLYTYMEIFKECLPLIIAPCNMLLTWEEEFKKWKVDIHFHNLNTLEFSGNESRSARKLVGNKPRGNKWNRIVKLYSWCQGKSVLGISYNLFEKLTKEGIEGSVKNKAGKEHRKVFYDQDCEDIRKILLERPTLLVLDEGHTPRNARSLIWKALSKIKTERRIILSGTPFQNNFGELYNTLWLARPTFADRISCKTQKIGRKSTKVPKVEEAREKWASLTSSISTNADDEFLEEVRTMIEPFVHVHRGSILQKNLPGSRDCVVLLNPPRLQKQILKDILSKKKKILKDIETRKNSLELEHVLSLVSVHPSLLTKHSWLGNDKTVIEKITAKSFKLNPNEGVKTRFLMELIRLSEALKEKVLVFSQYIDPFSLIKDQLRSLYNWTEGKEVLQMDGKLDVRVRQTLIKRFNDPCSEVRVLLASTKACCEGINLVGASRIVLLDVVWNPSVERQAISRAYRLGQKKVVYTYHLITSGTKEADKYCIQVNKDHLSKLVFSVNGDTDKQNISSAVSHDKILEEMVGHNKLLDMFDDIIYQPKKSDLVKTFGSVTSKQTGNGS